MTQLNTKTIYIGTKKTSVRLEEQMWTSLKEIAFREKCSVNDLCSLIYKKTDSKTSLTASIRIFIMLYFKSASTEDGHNKAGHGSFKKILKRSKKHKNFRLMPNIRDEFDVHL